MNKADKQMPLEIWTDINGNATRTQFKGGVKYIRADECDRLREALQQALDDIPGWVMLARAALTATSQKGQHG